MGLNFDKRPEFDQNPGLSHLDKTLLEKVSSSFSMKDVNSIVELLFSKDNKGNSISDEQKIKNIRSFIENIEIELIAGRKPNSLFGDNYSLRPHEIAQLAKLQGKLEAYVDILVDKNIQELNNITSSEFNGPKFSEFISQLNDMRATLNIPIDQPAYASENGIQRSFPTIVNADVSIVDNLSGNKYYTKIKFEKNLNGDQQWDTLTVTLDNSESIQITNIHSIISTTVSTGKINDLFKLIHDGNYHMQLTSRSYLS